MKTTRIMWLALFSLLVLLASCTPVKAVDVTVSPMTGVIFSNTVSTAAWTAKALSLGQQSMELVSSTETTNSGLVWASGQPVDVLISRTEDVLTFSAARSDSFPLEPAHGTLSIHFSTPIVAVGFGAFSPFNGYSVSVTDLYFNLNGEASYQPTVLDTAATSFTAVLFEFSQPVSSFSLDFDATFTSSASASDLQIFGVAEVPEPTALVLFVFGGFFLIFSRQGSRRRSLFC